MKYRECMIAYNWNGPIVVGQHPDKTGWSDKYQLTVGSCFLKVKEAPDQENLVHMLLDFHHAVVRDGVPVSDAHAAFWKIDEYREVMAGDVPKPGG